MTIGSLPGELGAGVPLVEEKEEKREIMILGGTRGGELYQFAGEKRGFEVIDYIREKYGEEYDFPGPEYLDYLNENPDKVPEELKDGRNYYLVGSMISHKGTSFIPSACWDPDGKRFYQKAGVSNSFWHVGGHVLLLKKKK